MPSLLRLYLFLLDDKIWFPFMIATHYMLPGLRLSQKSLYKLGEERIFHSLISFLTEYLTSALTPDEH